MRWGGSEQSSRRGRNRYRGQLNFMLMPTCVNCGADEVPLMRIIWVIPFHFRKFRVHYRESSPSRGGDSLYDRSANNKLSTHRRLLPVKNVFSLCVAVALTFSLGCTPEAPSDVDVSTSTSTADVSSNTTATAETPSSNVTAGGETPVETP